MSLTIPNAADVAISLFLTDSARISTRHALGLQTNYVSPSGDFTGSASFAPDTTLMTWPWVAGIDVVNPAVTGVIVTFGNSITDGVGSKADSNARWPDVLARRLFASKEPLKAIVNAGISGNRVLSPGAGPSALERFDRDVLMQPGVTHVIVLEGINDINGGTDAPNPRNEVSAEELIAGHQQLIDRAHEARGRDLRCNANTKRRTARNDRGAGCEAGCVEQLDPDERGVRRRDRLRQDRAGSGGYDAVLTGVRFGGSPASEWCGVCGDGWGDRSRTVPEGASLIRSARSSRERPPGRMICE